MSSGAIVAFGVVGEYIHEFKDWPKDHDKKRLFGEWSTIVLIVGLVIESLGLTRSMQLSNFEIANLRVQAASLENAAAQARLEISRVAPENLPITSIKAEMSFFITGTDNKEYNDSEYFRKATDEVEESAVIRLEDKEGNGIVKLQCIKYESHPVRSLRGADGVGPPIKGRKFLITLAWPPDKPDDEFDSGVANFSPNIAGGLPELEASVAGLDEYCEDGELILPGLIKSCRFMTWACVMTFNGVVQRQLMIPKMKPAFMNISCKYLKWAPR